MYTHTCIHIKYTQILIAVFFITVQNWKQTRLTSLREMVNRCGISMLWYALQRQKGNIINPGKDTE